jgi:uncharacterized protein YggE
MKRTIAVSGSGRASTVPDVADVRLGVSVSRKTVAEARATAAEVGASILAALIALGVERSDIRTASLVVQPEYDYKDGVQQLRGQSVSHQYVVAVRDLDQLGRVVDDGLAAGATTLDGVAFRTADPAAAFAAARVDAFRDARSRAQALATEAGVTLGAVIAIAEADPVGNPRPLGLGKARMLAAAEAAPTPIEAGEGEVVVGLTVIFAIG